MTLPSTGAGEGRLEHESHLDDVPVFAVGTPDVLAAPPLVDKPEPAKERDRCLVVREDAKRELV